MGRSRSPKIWSVCSNPSPRDLSPSSSVFSDWDTETMASSRPSSMAIPRTTSPINKAPSLSEILSNTAPPPWTLSAFMAYLSQNHCLETLEFVLDADRYRAAHDRVSHPSGDFSVPSGSGQICTLWQKVIDAYIMPCAPREVNLPAHVRDRLLRLQCSSVGPPHPSELDEAVQIVHELMNDSVLVPFLESVMPVLADPLMEEDVQEPRQGRSRLRIPRDGSTSGEEASQSPKAAFLPLLGINRMSTHRPISTSDLSEIELVTDDSSSPNSTPGFEPLTPPTTPPTSDFTSGGSPNTFQRAMSGNSWKKMGAKLGLGRKSKSSRRLHQSGTSSAEMDQVSTSDSVSRPPL